MLGRRLPLALAALVLVAGCQRDRGTHTRIERGRLVMTNGPTGPHLGEWYLWRAPAVRLYFQGERWQPADRKNLDDDIQWCAGSPNPEVEAITCTGESTVKYAPIILRVRDDRPEWEELDGEDGAAEWCGEDGRWIVLSDAFYDFLTGKREPIAKAKKGGRWNLTACAPDRKTLVTQWGEHTVDGEKRLNLRLTDVKSGDFTDREVSLRDNPWLVRQVGEDDAFAISRRFVWKKRPSGRYEIVEPALGEEIDATDPKWKHVY